MDPADVYGVSRVAVIKASHEDPLTCGAMKWPKHAAVFKNRILYAVQYLFTVI